MKDFLNRLNENLKGFRTVLAIFSIPLLNFIEGVVTGADTLSVHDLKVAALALSPVFVKACWTEVRPKVMRWMSGPAPS